MARHMESPFKNYSLDQDDEIISAAHKAEIRLFNNSLAAIAEATTDKLTHEDFLERVISRDESLLFQPAIEQIAALDFISFDGAAQQIAYAIFAGFEDAVRQSPSIDHDVGVEVKLVVSDNNPTHAEFTLSVANENDKD